MPVCPICPSFLQLSTSCCNPADYTAISLMLVYQISHNALGFVAKGSRATSAFASFH